ncbi:MAG: TrkA family potassium uptake protein [Desulfuromonadales bacterium]|nr:TrkA family potassium uptake protein [Desulfuromonadales bacterium]
MSRGAAEVSRLIAIVGCGRVGAFVAGELSRTGIGVLVIDRRESAFDLLPPEFSGFKLHGNAIEMAVLRSARLQEADCLLAVTRDDNTNLMVTQVARAIFAVPRVLSRVSDPKKEPVFRHFGIEVISTTKVTADCLLAALSRSGGSRP